MTVGRHLYCSQVRWKTHSNIIYFACNTISSVSFIAPTSSPCQQSLTPTDKGCIARLPAFDEINSNCHCLQLEAIVVGAWAYSIKAPTPHMAKPLQLHMVLWLVVSAAANRE